MDKSEAIMRTLAGQRNDALDAVAFLNGEVAALRAKVAELEAKLKKKKSPEPTP
jgi:uncharacterized small protein (DUF1192 family)